MWLVLCSDHDASGLWAYEGLKQCGLEPVELVTGTALSSARRWEHRVGVEGASITITLADGRTIRGRDVRGVLNRIDYTPPESLVLIRPRDQAYARQELYSFYLSWLSALPCPVLNRPTAGGLSGQWRHISEWIHLAARAGLPVPEYAESTRNPSSSLTFGVRFAPAKAPLTTAIVVSGSVVGAVVPDWLKPGCRRLAELAQTALLGVEFTVAPSQEWGFAGVSILPDLRQGGGPLLEALASALQNGLEAPR